MKRYKFCSGTVGTVGGLVAQSVMSATDTLGYQAVRGLSATDPHPRQWISVRTLPKDVGMLFLPVLVTAPHMFVPGDNTIPITEVMTV